MAVQFSILASNNDSLMGLGYSRVEVWQSIDSGDTYQEITASTAQAATLVSAAASTTFQMGGFLLKFIVNGGTETSVSFDPILVNWTPTQVASRINTVVPGLASVVGATVVLTAPTTGRISSVQITYSDSPNLGFSAGTIAYGKDPRITMVLGTLSYLFSDVAGTATARYKWRFSANGVNPFSDFSPYVFGTAVPLLPSNLLSVVSATFIGLDGKPVQTKLIVAMDQNPTSISGLVLTNGMPMQLTSDVNGFVQFTLVRGARVRVAIEGTFFIREFVVPNTPTFDLLAVMAAAPDSFTVQVPPPFLIRRNI